MNSPRFHNPDKPNPDSEHQQTPQQSHQQPKAQRLAFTPGELAESLGVSLRTLQEYTGTLGIPTVRMGKRIVYPVAAVERWLMTAAAPGIGTNNPGPDSDSVASGTSNSVERLRKPSGRKSPAQKKSGRGCR